MTNPYTKSISAYQRNQDENMTPMQIVAELYKGMVKFLYEAKSAYQANRLDEMNNKVQRIFSVIEALQAHLDLTQGGKDALFLNEFYIILSGRLGRVLDRQDPANEFDQLIAYVMPVYDRWQEFAYGPRKKEEEIAQ
jgi:flagellar biosynthetic protein FliS